MGLCGEVDTKTTLLMYSSSNIVVSGAHSMNRHVLAATSTLVFLGLVGYAWHSTFTPPIEVVEVRLGNEVVSQGEKLQVSYRYKVTRTNCRGTLIGEVHDGIETVRFFEGSLEVPEGALEVGRIIQIGLPSHAKPGKARLYLHAEFVCNRINTLGPIIIDMGSYTFTVQDEATESRSRLVSTLWARVHQLSMKVTSLTQKVDKLEENKRKTELNLRPAPIKTKVEAAEKRLSVKLPASKPKSQKVATSTISHKKHKSHKKDKVRETTPSSLYAWVLEMIK
jgi:hypothetical protein